MSFFHKLLEIKKCSKGNGVFAIDNIPINTITRKNYLLKNYGFNCDCTKCK